MYEKIYYVYNIILIYLNDKNNDNDIKDTINIKKNSPFMEMDLKQQKEKIEEKIYNTKSKIKLKKEKEDEKSIYYKKLIKKFIDKIFTTGDNFDKIKNEEIDFEKVKTILKIMNMDFYIYNNYKIYTKRYREIKLIKGEKELDIIENNIENILKNIIETFVDDTTYKEILYDDYNNIISFREIQKKFCYKHNIKIKLLKLIVTFISIKKKLNCKIDSEIEISIKKYYNIVIRTKNKEKYNTLIKDINNLDEIKKNSIVNLFPKEIKKIINDILNDKDNIKKNIEVICKKFFDNKEKILQFEYILKVNVFDELGLKKFLIKKIDEVIENINKKNIFIIDIETIIFLFIYVSCCIENTNIFPLFYEYYLYITLYKIDIKSIQQKKLIKMTDYELFLYSNDKLSRDIVSVYDDEGICINKIFTTIKYMVKKMNIIYENIYRAKLKYGNINSIFIFIYILFKYIIFLNLKKKKINTKLIILEKYSYFKNIIKKMESSVKKLLNNLLLIEIENEEIFISNFYMFNKFDSSIFNTSIPILNEKLLENIKTIINNIINNNKKKKNLFSRSI